MEVELLSGACGAEIAGINLRDTSNGNINIIKGLLFEHKVVFFSQSRYQSSRTNKFI